jgi:hypothetical protein
MANALFPLRFLHFTYNANSATSAMLDSQCEKAGHPEVPVAEGSHEPLKVLWSYIIHMYCNLLAHFLGTVVIR